MGILPRTRCEPRPFCFLFIPTKHPRASQNSKISPPSNQGFRRGQRNALTATFLRLGAKLRPNGGGGRGLLPLTRPIHLPSAPSCLVCFGSGLPVYPGSASWIASVPPRAGLGISGPSPGYRLSFFHSFLRRFDIWHLQAHFFGMDR